MLFFLWLLAVQTVALARPVMRAGRADFFSPTAGGGSFLNRGMSSSTPITNEQ